MTDPFLYKVKEGDNMENKRKLSSPGVVVDIILEQICLFALYMNGIFRTVNNTARPISTGAFIVFILASDIIGFKLLSHRKEIILNSWLIVVWPFGIYTYLTYITLFKLYIICSLSAVLLFTGLFALLLYRSKFKDGIGKSGKQKEYISKCAFFMHFAMTLCMTVLLVFMIINRISGNNILNSKTQPSGKPDSAYSIEECIDDLMILEEDNWKAANTESKLNVLGIIANIEGDSMGITHTFTVGTSKLEDKVYGGYSNDTFTVYIDIDHLEYSDPRSVVNTVCHEVRHCYQHMTVLEYENADESSKGLLIYKEAAKYKEEFENYPDVEENPTEYFYLACETDARAYAREAAPKYFEAVDKHSGNSRSS